MRHHLLVLLVFACFATLFLGFFSPVFFSDRQFGFRDAAHFYYPLYQRVQKEWEEGRWPLWEPEENAGMPLLGNPTAAVLYPGKLIYAALPYAWGARVYIVAHTALAFIAMLVLMRSWKVTWTGSGLGALAYAFGVPILFQSCNVIYLVGAAWLPLGFHAVDRWVRLGRRWGILELAVVLTMQSLGGDPQASYLLGLAALGYAGGLSWQRGASRGRRTATDADSRSSRARVWSRLFIGAVVIVGWVVVTLVLAQVLPTLRPKTPHPPRPIALPWMHWVPPAVSAVWLVAGLGFLALWRLRGRRFPLGIAAMGLAGSAVLAVALSAAQLFPVIEFTQQTSRAAVASPHDIYPFSIEPLRFAGLLWPNIMGVQFDRNSFWADMLRMPGTVPKMWVPSLYLGVLVLALGMGALGFRGGAPHRVWLSSIFVVSVLLSLGQYTSPIWAARVLEKLTNYSALHDLVREIGPLDPEDTTAIRIDRYMRDGDGSLYWIASTLLPGFRQFRYPAKLFTFGLLALAALAGLGWDGLRAGGRRRFNAIAATLVLLSLALLVVVLIERPEILGRFRAHPATSSFGPVDPDAAYAEIVRALVQTTVVLTLGLVAVRLSGTRPLWAGALALVAATGDLAAANARFVLTVPQSLFESTPEMVRLIREAERAKPSPGPFRVHRMPTWELPVWSKSRSASRNDELVIFERDTIQPKYGINFGIEYAHTLGVAEIYEYEWYYGGFFRKVRSTEVARALNLELDKDVVYFPRRTFDMWNTRYFILPMFANGWHDEFRGFATFLQGSERIYPDPEKFRGPADEQAKDWIEHHDVQLRRNLNEHPRAWIVHNARTLAPAASLSMEERGKVMQEIVYSDDGFWHDSAMQVYDPLQLAWVESDHFPDLARYLPDLREGARKLPETVRVTYPSPQRVEIEAKLARPGLVVLADVYYPGWELTIDGKPAPIYPVNRLMRGAAVEAGPTHHLVYTYFPRSFRVGRVVSLSGMGVLALLALAFSLRPVDPIVGPPEDSTLGEPISDEVT